MVSFPLHVICGYPSYEQLGDVQKNQNEWDAMNLVKSVKGLPFPGYADFTQIGPRFKVVSGDTDRARTIARAGELIAEKIAGYGIPKVAVVPVPSSSHTTYGEQFTGSLLADAAARSDARLVSCPIVVFDQKMPKSSGGGGTRAPGALLPHLRLAKPLPNLPIVVIDDVASTHGHIKAVARLIEREQHQMLAAVCVAQTVWERPEYIFRIPSRQLDSRVWPE